MKRMFSEVEMVWDVAVCAKDLKGQSPPHHQILYRLLQDLMYERACEEHGFYLGVTAVKSIGNIKKKNNNDGDNHQAQVLTFPVSFTCRTFLPARGDILQGVVTKVWSDAAVSILSGPLRLAYLSRLKMPGYHFVPPESEDEKPCFQRDDLTKIAVGVVVRFVVLDRRFKEGPDGRNDVYVLASIEDDDTLGPGDDSLGPVSLTGLDSPYM